LKVKNLIIFKSGPHILPYFHVSLQSYFKFFYNQGNFTTTQQVLTCWWV